MKPRTCSILLVSCLLLGGVASAQPAASDKVDAKSLMQSGIRLLEAKDYLGALAVFKDAYARFPSAKILLNIGTTLNLLDRKADAANAYQRYLDAPDADAARKSEVAEAVAELDKGLGVLTITVTPADAEVQVNDDEWQRATPAKLVRVADGPYTVRARKDKFETSAKSARIAIGEKATVELVLTALPEEAPRIVTGPLDQNMDVGAYDSTQARPSRVGGLAIVHLDLPRKGGAGFIGATFDATEQLQVQAAAILGPNYGFYAGAALRFLPGMFRPYVAAGMPVFFSSGARFAARGAGGVEVVVNRHLSALLELGVEVVLNPEDDIIKTVFIPALGIIGHL